MAWSGVHAVRFRISQLLWVLHEFAAQSGLIKLCTDMSVKWWKQLGNTLSPWFFLEQFLCAWLWEQPWLVQSKGRCRWREVHHCRMGGMWLGQDVCCSTSIPSTHIAAHSSGCLQTWMLHCCWGTASQPGVEAAHQGRISGGEQNQRSSVVLSELRIVFR